MILEVQRSRSRRLMQHLLSDSPSPEHQGDPPLGTISACHHQPPTSLSTASLLRRRLPLTSKRRAFAALAEATAESLAGPVGAFLGSAGELLSFAKLSFPARAPQTATAHQFVGDALLVGGDLDGAHRHFRRALHILSDRWEARGRLLPEERATALQVVYRYVPVLLQLGHTKRATEVVNLSRRLSHANSSERNGALADCLACWSDALKGTAFQPAVDAALALFLEQPNVRAARFGVERVRASAAQHQAFSASIQAATPLVRGLMSRLTPDAAPARTDRLAWTNFCLALTDLVHALEQMETRVEEGSDAAIRYEAARRVGVDWLENHAIRPDWGPLNNDANLLVPAMISLGSGISEDAYEILEQRVRQFAEDPNRSPLEREALKYRMALVRAERAMMVWDDLEFADRILQEVGRQVRTDPTQQLSLNLLLIRLRYLQSHGSGFPDAFQDGLTRINKIIELHPTGSVPSELLLAMDAYRDALDDEIHRPMQRELERKQRRLAVRDMCMKSAADGLTTQLADWVRSCR